MRRKEKKQRKKFFKRIALLFGLFAFGGVALGVGIGIPYLKNFLSPESQVKSAYIKKASKEDVANALTQKKIKYEKIEVADEGESYSATLNGGEVVKFSSSKDVPEQVNTLHRLLRRLTIDNVQVKQIDLRFTRPVVKY